MKYLLTVRRFDENDLSSKCPFLPEFDDLDMYLNSLVEDIGNIEGVLDVIRNDFEITIKVNKSIEKNALLKTMEPCFTDRRACEYRYVALESL